MGKAAVPHPETLMSRGRTNVTVKTLEKLKSEPVRKGKSATVTTTGRAGPFDWEEGDYTSQVNGDPQEGVYVKANGVAVTQGVWVRNIKGFVTEAMFGADRSRTDNHIPIQGCWDWAAANGVRVEGTGEYETGYPVYMPSLLEWAGVGKIKNSNNVNPNQMLCILPGNYHPAYFDDLTYYNCNSAKPGRVLATSTASEAGNFAAGDNVFVRSAEYYEGNNGIELPLYSSMNRVVSADDSTGIIVLEFPILDSVASPKIGHADNSVPDVLADRDLYCCYKPRVHGLSLESVNGNCLERGGFLGADFYFPTMKSLTGVFTNAASFSEIKVGLIECDRKPFDVAGGSISTRIKVGTVSYRKTARSEDTVMAALNENARAVSITGKSFVAEGFDYPSRAMLQFGSATDCRFQFDEVQNPDCQGVMVQFVNNLRDGAGETQAQTKGNKAVIAKAVGGSSMQRHVRMINTGGLCSGNEVEGDFSGTPTVNGATIEGDENKVKGKFTGVLSINGATNYKVDADFTGVTGLQRDDGGTVLLNGQPVNGAQKIKGSQPAAIAAANSVTPDILENGSFQRVTYTNNASFTVNNPLNVLGGDDVVLVLRADNLSASLVPSFGTNYNLAGETISGIDVGNESIFWFTAPDDGKLVLSKAVQNYAP